MCTHPDCFVKNKDERCTFGGVGDSRGACHDGNVRRRNVKHEFVFVPTSQLPCFEEAMRHHRSNSLQGIIINACS